MRVVKVISRNGGTKRATILDDEGVRRPSPSLCRAMAGRAQAIVEEGGRLVTRHCVPVPEHPRRGGE